MCTHTDTHAHRPGGTTWRMSYSNFQCLAKTRLLTKTSHAVWRFPCFSYNKPPSHFSPCWAFQGVLGRKDAILIRDYNNLCSFKGEMTKNQDPMRFPTEFLRERGGTCTEKSTRRGLFLIFLPRVRGCKIPIPYLKVNNIPSSLLAVNTLSTIPLLSVWTMNYSWP